MYMGKNINIFPYMYVNIYKNMKKSAFSSIFLI
jgi:hypothetical protein